MSGSFNAPINNRERQGGGERQAGVSSALIAASLGSKVGHLSKLCMLAVSAVHTRARRTSAQPATPSAAAGRLPQNGRPPAAAVWFAYASSSIAVYRTALRGLANIKTGAVTTYQSCTAEQQLVCLLCALAIKMVLVHCLAQGRVCSALTLT